MALISSSSLTASILIINPSIQQLLFLLLSPHHDDDGHNQLHAELDRTASKSGIDHDVTETGDVFDINPVKGPLEESGIERERKDCTDCAWPCGDF
ncbi:hypothetical protein L1987_45671 [Smallanthus sonchifolius]|uniref:Uncharacterized protein n=1 Tax=Smallanthus sonchifolius TaxID=185202 RepID=A0ACB9FXI1_9ASTR|nr:hypothetical protein L1987_45671 [Smallanthus sonchifolius]